MEVLLQALRRYHQQRYTAEAATLVVYSRFSPEEVLAAVEPIVMTMPARSDPNQDHVFSFLPPEEPLLTSLGGWVNVKSLRDDRRLRLLFPVPLRKVLQGRNQQAKRLFLKPCGYISHILGHECDSSVLGVCKALHYVTEMMVGPAAVDDDYELLTVSFTLTQHGMANLLHIIELTYLNIYQAVCDGTVNEEVYTDMREESKLSFESSDISQPTEHCIGLSTNAKCIQLSQYTQDGTLHQESLSQDIRQLWAADDLVLPNAQYCEADEEKAAALRYVSHLHPRNCMVSLIWGSLPSEGDESVEPETESLFQGLPSFCQQKATQKTKYHQTPYSTCCAIPEEVLSQWERTRQHGETTSPSAGLALPPLNPYIATDFTLFHPLPPAEETDTVRDPPVSVLPVDETERRTTQQTGIIRSDPRHHTFKTALVVSFISPVAYQTPLSRLFLLVFRRMVAFKLTELRYFGELASLQNELGKPSGGLNITLSGPYHKLIQFLTEMMEVVFRDSTGEEEKEKFAIYLEEVSRGIKNIRTEQPYQTALRYAQHVISVKSITAEDILSLLKCEEHDLTYDKYTLFVKEFLQSGVLTESYAAGNMESEAHFYQLVSSAVQRTLETNKASHPVNRESIPRFRDYYSLEKRKGAINVLRCSNRLEGNPVAEDPNKAVVLSVCMSDAKNVRRYGIAKIVSKLTSSLFFSALRSKETLGYIVASRLAERGGHYYMDFIVQSAIPEIEEYYLLSRVIAFLDAFRDEALPLEERFPPETIRAAKEGLYGPLAKRPDSVDNDLNLLRSDYFHPLQFGRRAAEREVLGETEGSITPEEVYTVLRQLCSETFWEHFPTTAIFVNPGTKPNEEQEGAGVREYVLPPLRKDLNKDGAKEDGEEEEEEEQATEERELILPTYENTSRSVKLCYWKEVSAFQEGLEVIRSNSF
ncbi:insulysin [Angomonas deanei]|uniref:Peptidase M16 inactive domain/Middle or third domain of peptidase_M16, putative n=1 Tax=Angomonas deanei TaxID=59799 RepID=A0A7G2C4J4_9TRYP|nr:insulysin [Angomonas deanei]CAD2213653.1 Peptidase M16 inactive domain/Middle or third domain of peptidase_M16, putative [Angomonas deanei]|eukprot:EPY29759.1 insulysin [Angomonas deanei]